MEISFVCLPPVINPMSIYIISSEMQEIKMLTINKQNEATNDCHDNRYWKIRHQ